MQLRISLSIGLLSAAVISFQLILMQILSIVQWYHFAYMVISVALLGFGASGTLLAIFRKWFVEKYDSILPLLMLLAGVFFSIVTGISQSSFARFDSYLLFSDGSHILKLFLTYFIFFIPFFISALAIGLTFIKSVQNIGNLYFANMIGSGIGGLLALGLMWFLTPEYMPGINAILPVIAGILILPNTRRKYFAGISFISFVIVLLNIIYPPQLVLSEFKSLSKTLNMPDSEIIIEKSSPYGLIQIVKAPAIRYAPGLSLGYQLPINVSNMVFSNGNWFDAIIPFKRDTTAFLNYTTSALPYSFGEINKILILDSKTGSASVLALSKNAKDIKLVEPNTVIISLLNNELADQTDSLLYHSNIEIIQSASRTFLLSDRNKYDLIILPTIDAFGGTGGMQAIQEQYLLTKDAFKEMWNHLSPDGKISITCWMDYPFRNPLKILATFVEVLEDLKVKNPAEHLAVIRSWGTVTFTLKKSPLTKYETNLIRAFCNQMFFDPVILPNLPITERSGFNSLQDKNFFGYVDSIFWGNRHTFYSSYNFNITPATDNKPYFFQFFKLESINYLRDNFGYRAIPYFEIGYVILVITLFQIIAAALFLIILPLFKIGWSGKNKLWIILYFSGLGFGYMFIEIIFIQRFTLYLGNPIYSAAAVISLMLISSGTGSYYSSKSQIQRKNFFVLIGTIVTILFLYSFILTPILQKTIGAPVLLKVFLTSIIIAFPAFFMGFPFPLGLRYVSQISESHTPWAWGINGCISVISSALATVIAVEIGFIWVMVFAALAYCIAMVVNIFS